MKHYSAYSIAIAICLSALAGYVDAVGFLELHGYFVSFMSGNSTRLAVSIAQSDWHHFRLIAAILALFISGSALGSVIGHKAGSRLQPFAIVFCVTIILTLAAFCNEAGQNMSAILLMTLAMGAVNTVFQRNGDIVIGLTYMTGALAKIGQRIAFAFLGGGRWEFLPYLLLWLGLVSGGISGVVLFAIFGLQSVWLAVLWAAILSVIIRRHSPA